MKITIKNISDRPQVLDLTKIISFKTVISSERSYSLNLREDKVTLINEFLKDNEIFEVLGNEKKIELIKEEKKEEEVKLEEPKVELEKSEKIKDEESEKEIEEIKITSKKKSSSKKKSK